MIFINNMFQNLNGPIRSAIIHEDKLTERTLYMTNNGNFFMLFRNGEIVPRTEESAKEYLGEKDVEKYIEVWGKPEDA